MSDHGSCRWNEMVKRVEYLEGRVKYLGSSEGSDSDKLSRIRGVRGYAFDLNVDHGDFEAQMERTKRFANTVCSILDED